MQAAPLPKPVTVLRAVAAPDEAVSPPQQDPEAWVQPLRWIALLVFTAVPILGFFAQPLAGRLVWTVAVASLPLFIVLVGYHRWRRICPLAFIAQIPVLLKRPGSRRAPVWLEANYYYVAFSIFLFSLWLRLIATNGDGRAIAAFFIALSFVALLFGLFFTGKTWCNYICPVSFIEKIYTEPHGLRETRNSQCVKCSACKKQCPDINEENGYWKEIASSPKKFAYFAFPGLVFGFYYYYFLQSGTWDYYFGGSWTRQPGVIATAFLPGRDAATAGFFFLPEMPRAAAAFLTLAACGVTSLLFFTLLERPVGSWLKRRAPEADDAFVRHVMFTLAAFTAFVTFYSFAGAPTLRLVPSLQHFFLIAIVITATLFLARRLRRTQRAFAEDTLARSILKRWEWPDIPPPKDLHDAFLIHTIRAHESARTSGHVLQIYMDSVRETLANGFVTYEDVQMLESLRNKLRIKKADHKSFMAQLAEEERTLINDPSKQVSAEKRLQLKTYSRALEKHLKHAPADDGFVLRLRREYGVTPEEHAAVLDTLLGGAQGMVARLSEDLRVLESAGDMIQALDAERSPSNDLLGDLLFRAVSRAVDRMLRTLGVASDDEIGAAVRQGLCSAGATVRRSSIDALASKLSRSIGERLLAALSQAAQETRPANLSTSLIEQLQSADPYIRAVALSIVADRGASTPEMLDRLGLDEHELVRETALYYKQPQEVRSRQPSSTVRRMIALRSTPIFALLGAESLAELARSSVEINYEPNQVLFSEGQRGSEVFILLAGETKVMREDGECERIVGTEQAGAIIGEMAVLDPGPRSATVIAGPGGAHVLELDGDSFHNALEDDPAIASGVIRTLVQRLRR